MSNGNRGGSHDQGGYESAAPRESSSGDDSAPEHREPREPREQPSQAPREQQSAQAPLDLPPPPQAKPFVVWSSTPAEAPAPRRED
jgi:hypothetical protein